MGVFSIIIILLELVLSFKSCLKMNMRTLNR